MPWIPCAYPPCGRLHQRPPSDLARGIRHCSRECARRNYLAGGWQFPQGRTGRRQVVWSAAEDDYLRRKYDSHPATLDHLTMTLRRSRFAVKQRARVLGITRSKAPIWTERELIYLRKWLGKKSLSEIATHLQRTKVAVTLKAKRLHLCQNNTDYTARALEDLLGWEAHFTIRLIGKGWLQATRREAVDRDTGARPAMWRITEADLRACILAHPELVNPRRIGDWPWFLDLITDGGVTRAYMAAAHQGA